MDKTINTCARAKDENVKRKHYPRFQWTVQTREFEPSEQLTRPDGRRRRGGLSRPPPNGPPLSQPFPAPTHSHPLTFGSGRFSPMVTMFCGFYLGHTDKSDGVMQHNIIEKMGKLPTRESTSAIYQIIGRRSRSKSQ